MSGLDPTGPDSEGDWLARLRVAADTGVLPPDLGQWLLQALDDLLPRRDRTAARDAYLRRAALCLSGTLWQRAGVIERMTRGVLASPGPRPNESPVRALVRAAVEAAPAKGRQPSRRTIHRVLVAGEIP